MEGGGHTLCGDDQVFFFFDFAVFGDSKYS